MTLKSDELAGDGGFDVFGFEGRKDSRPPQSPRKLLKGGGYITLSLSSRAKTILIMSYISKETLGVAGLFS